MNIMNSLTLRHLKLNKKRTIVTIIGVILSVSMITAVATFATSFLNMMQRNSIENTGNFHVQYKNVSSENIDEVMNDKNTSTASLSKDIGYAILKGSKNQDKPYLFIKSFDQEGFKAFNLKLIEGRFPQNSDEIVLSSHISENGGVNYKVGDTIKWDIGQRYLDASNEMSLLSQDCSFENQNENESGETFIPQGTKEYTVTGIIEKPNFELYWSPGYTVITYLDKNEFTSADTVDISVVWKKVSKKVNEEANALASSLGIPSENVNYNGDLLHYYGIMNDDLLSTLYGFAAVVIVFIIIGSVALIYNSFAISISERSRHLGILASVGATKKQKSSSVFFEGFVVGIIGIPLGIVFGMIGMGITFIFVQPLLGDIVSKGVKLKLVTSPLAILSSVLLSILTILISVYIPAKRASKISPVDAIRQSKDVKLTSKTVKTSKITRLIFGFEAELGLKNLKRNSRRYKATIFSLVISIVLFLSVSSMSLFFRKSVELAIAGEPYDIKVSVVSSSTAEEKKDFYTAIAKMDYADESIIEHTMDARVDIESRFIPDEIKTILYGEQNTKTYETHFKIISIDDVTLNRYAIESGTSATRLKDTENPCGIIVNTITTKTANDKYLRMNRFNIEVGEKLKFADVEKDNPNNTILEIVALTDKTPIGGTMLNDVNQATLIVSEEVFASMLDHQKYGDYNTDVDMLIKSSDPTSLTSSIKEYQKSTSISNVDLYDVAAINKQNNENITLIFVFFYGFVALIAAICMANIFNTISTSISLRRREFAMLKSVGMTPKGFNKMIKYESLFYGVKGLLYGLPISFFLMYLIYKVLNNSFEFEFTIPWGSVIVAIIAVFAIVTLTMIYSSSKVKKENIIDVLKNENI